MKNIKFKDMKNLDDVLSRAEKIAENEYNLSCGNNIWYVNKILEKLEKFEYKRGIRVHVKYCSHYGISFRVYNV